MTEQLAKLVMVLSSQVQKMRNRTAFPNNTFMGMT